MKKVKTKINSTYNSVLKGIKKKLINIKDKCIDIKKNPKKELYNFVNYMMLLIKNNILFLTFIMVSLFNSVLLRYFTISTMDNVLFFKPFLFDLVVILVVGGLGFLVKEKNRIIYYLLSSLVLTLICIINSIYYTFYTSFASISLLATSKYVVAVGDAVVENVLRVQDLSYLWAPLAILIVYIKLRRQKNYKKENKNRKEPMKAISALVTAGITLFFVLLTVTPLEAGRLVKQWNREYLVMNFGIYVYHLNDLVKSIEPQITTLFGYDNAMKTFTEYYSDVTDTRDYTNKYTGIFEGKNIISIHAESMQAFAMGLTFNGVEVTPNLNKLAKKSLNFTNFYSQVSVGTSSDSEFTLNTSLMPTNNGTAFVSYFDRTYVSIPKLLKEKGYYTFAMHANNASYWNRNVMHKSLGYDKLYSKTDYDIDDVIGLGLADKSFFKQSIEYIKKINAKGNPYYGTMIMLTNHTPFSEVEKYGEFPVDIKTTTKDAEGNTVDVTLPYMEGTTMGNYLKSLHYADQALGEFLAGLEEAGLMENTVIMLYGDHDARLPKGDFNRLLNYDKTTGELYEETDERYTEVDSYKYELLRKVPFMIYSKETETKLHKNIDTVMGMYDVMPTISNMFNFYNKYQLGTDIFNTIGDNVVVFPNGNWMTNKVYYNAQKGEYLSLASTVIDKEYIKQYEDYAAELLNVSNSLIVYDLLDKVEKNTLTSETYIDERISK